MRRWFICAIALMALSAGLIHAQEKSTPKPRGPVDVTPIDVTAYHVDTPAKHVNTAIEVLADAMQNSIFPEKSFNREYHVVQRELEKGEEERSSVLWRLLSELAYREHPLRHPVVGYLH